MNRPIQVGDIFVVKVGTQNYSFQISQITPEGIRAGNYLVVPLGGAWKVSGYQVPHSLSFYQRASLKIITLNLGYNVMSNQVAGSETNLVKMCQEKYNGGWKEPQKISSCTYNVAQLLSKYTLFGVQEVNSQYQKRFLEVIRELRPSANFQFISGGNIIIGFDQYVTGEGISLTPPNHKLGDRGLQAIWFPKLELLFINLHAPHGVDLISEVKKSLENVKVIPKNVIMVGDFNDYTGSLLNRSIDLFGHQLKIPTGTSPKTCCTDSGYNYPGDYIFTDMAGHYGYPEGYIRGNPLISDHDPVVLIPKGKDTYFGIVTIAGNNTEVLLDEADPEQLFSRAKDYVREKNLNWEIQKPRAWSKPTSGPHVSLLPEMRKYLGERVEAKLGDIYHFTDAGAKWVVYDVKLPSKFKCGYPCHLSIGQQ